MPQHLGELQSYAAAHPGPAVWQARLGRDQTRSDLADQVSEAVQRSRRLCATTGFAEQDPIYRQFKTRLIGREAYQYRLTVQEFCP